MRKGARLLNTLFDEKRLSKLIANLDILTGVPANILDVTGRDIRLFSGHPPFCRRSEERRVGKECRL